MPRAQLHTSHQRPKRTIRPINRVELADPLGTDGVFLPRGGAVRLVRRMWRREGTECYYSFLFCNPAFFQVLTARDGGTKFTNEGPGCFECGDWELEEAASGAGTPQSIEMQRA